MEGGETAANQLANRGTLDLLLLCSIFYLAPFFAFATVAACNDGHMGHDLAPAPILMPHSLTHRKSRIMPNSPSLKRMGHPK